MQNFTFTAIGTVESAAQYRQDAPRQSVYASAGAFLRWTDSGYSNCAVDLEGFDRIWLIWVFDRNISGRWHAKVRVPVPAEQDRYSVFATRSPYRPNPIGISAVELRKITPEGLYLGACDLLDGTAVLDVKPYIPQVDAFPESRAGWRDRIDSTLCKVEFAPRAVEQIQFVQAAGAPDIRNFCLVQLASRPTDKSRKRVEFDAANDQWVIHYRTWKIFFEYDQTAGLIMVKSIDSNYSESDLAPGMPDKYLDKALHRDFKTHFRVKN